jgi:hypothetical protein
LVRYSSASELTAMLPATIDITANLSIAPPIVAFLDPFQSLSKLAHDRRKLYRRLVRLEPIKAIEQCELMRDILFTKSRL